MKILTLEQTKHVAGGGAFLDFVGTGAAAGSVFGMFLGYWTHGTLASAAAGAAGFGAIGGALAAIGAGSYYAAQAAGADELGSAIGSSIFDLIQGSGLGYSGPQNGWATRIPRHNSE